MSDASLSSSSTSGSSWRRKWQIDNNHHVINKIANNDPSVSSLEIAQATDDSDPDILQYFVQPDDCKQLELLGELVGVNTHLKELRMNGEDSGIDPFYAGLSNNKSISNIKF